IKGPIYQVNSQNPQCFLLQAGLVLLKMDVKYYFIELFLFGIQLVSNPDPAMSFECFCKIYGRYRIGKCKKEFIGMFFPANTLFHKSHLMGYHFFEAGLGYISPVFLGTIYGIAKILVIGAHCLGDGSRSTPGPKKMPGSFLTGTNFGKSAVNIWIEINSQGLRLYGWDIFKCS